MIKTSKKMDPTTKFEAIRYYSKNENRNIAIVLKKNSKKRN